MKKLMIIAVILGGMLMPAQVFAKNDRNDRRGDNKVQMDYNRAKKDNKSKEIKIGSNKGNKHVAAHAHKPAPVVVHHKPAPVVVHHKPAPVVVHHNPAPVVHHHCPPPAPVVHHHHCNNEVAQAAAVVVGIAGLISILAH